MLIVVVVCVVLTIISIVSQIIIAARFRRVLRANLRGVAINKMFIAKNRETMEGDREAIKRSMEQSSSVAKGVHENAEKIGNNAELIKANHDLIAANRLLIESNQERILNMRSQMFLYEAQLSRMGGNWVLSKDGERKFYEPGRVVKVESDNSDEETLFKYTDKTVTCVVKKGGRRISEHVFALNGAPLSGTIFDSGKIVRKFKYDELGQVSEAK